MRNRPQPLLSIVVAGMLAAGVLANRTIDAQPLPSQTACSSTWTPTFGGGPGTDGPILAMAQFDDGTGPALYVGGRFGFAGGIPASNIARWDGASWSSVGAGLNDEVHAFEVFDDGSGPALYVGGRFTRVVGGSQTGNLARWDGSSWSAVAGIGGYSGVRALEVFDDGTGPQLYVGGDFWAVGNVIMNQIARWDGVTLSPLGSGVTSNVRALFAHDDGSGPALFVAGDALSVNGVLGSDHIARWDGASWSAVGPGPGLISSLAEYDDGGGPRLYASSWAPGPSMHVWCWDGAAWTEAGQSPDYEVHALAVYDDGGGPALFAGGWFYSAGGVETISIARYDGTWSSVGGGVSERWAPRVNSLAVFDDGTGARLFAGGEFTGAGGQPARNVASWGGAGWARAGEGMIGGTVSALAVHDEGCGEALYVGGYLAGVAAVPVRGVARWDGFAWSSLGTGVDGNVMALAEYGGGSGSHLIVGGRFDTAGGLTVNGIASWDGASWASLGSGVTRPYGDAYVASLAVHDDGSGPVLFVGGSFTMAGAVSAYSIARWDGTSWSPSFGSGYPVEALAVYDDGSGPKLYAAGGFSVTGTMTWNVARFDDPGVTVLGGGTDGPLYALVPFDDGTGPALYAGGEFTTVDGLPARSIARWDGTAWSALGDIERRVSTLFVFDDGAGPALYAGGYIWAAAGQQVLGLARWDGLNWSSTGLGTTAVHALASFDDGSGTPSLFAGGDFMTSTSGDSLLAKYGCAGAGPNTFCSGETITCPCANVGAPDAGCDDASGAGGVSIEVACRSGDAATLVGRGYSPGDGRVAVLMRSETLEPTSSAFGDGVRCVSTSGLVRLAASSGLSGTSAHVIRHGSLAGSGAFYYQLWYRNEPSTFCDPFAAFNLSSGVRITW